MNVRNVFGCMLVLALLLLPGFVGCQPLGSNSSVEDLTKSVKKLSDQFAIWTKPPRVGRPEDLNELGVKVATVENGLRANVNATYEHGTMLGQVAKKVNRGSWPVGEIEGRS